MRRHDDAYSSTTIQLFQQRHNKEESLQQKLKLTVR